MIVSCVAEGDVAIFMSANLLMECRGPTLTSLEAWVNNSNIKLSWNVIPVTFSPSVA